MLGLLSCALKRVIIELCQEKSSNHEKHGWNFYAKVVFLQPPRSKYAKAYLKYMVLKSLVSMKKFIGRLSFDQDELLYILEWNKRLLHY